MICPATDKKCRANLAGHTVVKMDPERDRVVTCASCGQRLPTSHANSAPADRQPCPGCGSLARNVALQLTGELPVRSGLRLKQRRPGTKGWVLHALLHMPGIQGSTGRPNRLTRIIDKLTDTYEESVTDDETGRVLHRQSHRLSEHRGHGDDKGPRTSPPPQTSTPEAEAKTRPADVNR